MAHEMMLTFQTRLTVDAEANEILQQYAILMSSVERSLFAEVAKGKRSTSCKNDFLKQYGITARQFNACRASLDGKVSACQAANELAIANLKRQIESLSQQIQKLTRKPSREKTLHLKKRRKQMLSDRLAVREEDLRQKRVRLCFGGKKLFHAQFHLEKNGYSSHAEWKKDWEEHRNNEFFVLGSKDESGGNQTCTARIQKNGKFCLRLRLPTILDEQYGKYIEFNDVSFTYGHEKIAFALNHPEGQAISYRFKKDDKGWRVFASTAIKEVNSCSQQGIGVIGIDLNADHIAYVETDRFGNPISKEVLPWVSYGKTNEQLKAITGNICKEIVQKAIEAKKPLVIEKLNFQEKKGSLKGGYDKFSRLLSGFAYGLFFKMLQARAFKHGIHVHQVNPAYTSIIGRVNYAKRYGLSTHLAAAPCIARRYQDFSEKPVSSKGIIPDGKGSHFAFVLPERNRTKHVWHFWSRVKKKLTTALAAHHRAKCNRSSSPSNGSLRQEIPDDYW